MTFNQFCWIRVKNMIYCKCRQKSTGTEALYGINTGGLCSFINRRRCAESVKGGMLMKSKHILQYEIAQENTSCNFSYHTCYDNICAQGAIKAKK